MRNCDYLVVGAGIGGATAAYGLARHGRVIVAEREDIPGYHTTGRSAAFFAETYGNEAVRKLTTASKSFFLNPPQDFTHDPLVHDRKALFIARPDQLEALDILLAEKRAHLKEVERLTSAEVYTHAPLLRPGYAAAGIWDPECRDIDVNALHRGFLRGARKRGAELLTSTGIHAITRSGPGWLTETADGPITARYIVNAAGAWGDDIAIMAGARPLGLIPKRRTVILFTAPTPLKHNGWPLLLDVEDQFYLKPESGRVLASPGDETPMPPQDVQPDEMDIALTVERLTRAFDFEVPTIERKWAGLRTFAPDDTPVVGWDPKVDGFFWCVGQGGFGMQTAPTISGLVEFLATRNPVPDRLQAHGITDSLLSPTRFIY